MEKEENRFPQLSSDLHMYTTRHVCHLLPWGKKSVIKANQSKEKAVVELTFVSTHHCAKIRERNHLKGNRTNFGSHFVRVLSW